MKFYGLILALLGGEVTSFLAPSNQRHAIKQPNSAISPLSKRDNITLKDFSLQASEISGGGTGEKPSRQILQSSIAVGAVTATTGFLYGKVLGLSLTTVWKKFPALVLEKFGALNPAYFITGVCTFGGLLMGILSSKFNATFTVADFVSAFSSAPIQTLPSSTIHLFPLLLMSLITSTFGFSVGPEGMF